MLLTNHYVWSLDVVIQAPNMRLLNSVCLPGNNKKRYCCSEQIEQKNDKYVEHPESETYLKLAEGSTQPIPKERIKYERNFSKHYTVWRYLTSPRIKKTLLTAFMVYREYPICLLKKKQVQGDQQQFVNVTKK